MISLIFIFCCEDEETVQQPINNESVWCAGSYNPACAVRKLSFRSAEERSGLQATEPIFRSADLGAWFRCTERRFLGEGELRCVERRRERDGRREAPVEVYEMCGSSRSTI